MPVDGDPRPDEVAAGIDAEGARRARLELAVELRLLRILVGGREHAIRDRAGDDDELDPAGAERVEVALAGRWAGPGRVARARASAAAHGRRRGIDRDECAHAARAPRSRRAPRGAYPCASARAPRRPTRRAARRAGRARRAPAAGCARRARPARARAAARSGRSARRASGAARSRRARRTRARDPRAGE